MGGWVARDSTDALARIEHELASKPDNARKLAEAEVASAHLFVWLDYDMPGEMACPLMGSWRGWTTSGYPSGRRDFRSQ